MLKLDFQNLLSDTIGKENGLIPIDMAALSTRTPSAHQKLNEWRKSEDALFFDSVFDRTLTHGIKEAADDIASRFENLVVLGIGGSALGLRAAAQALLPPFWNQLSPAARNNRPKLFVCDNVDPESFAALMKLIDIKKSCFTVISKSGKTTETAAQFFIALEALKKALGKDWSRNLVFITDPKAGELRPMATKEKILAFPIPPKLGGRFSVLSPVGLFPAACLGIDIEAMLDGAREMAKRCETDQFSENPAYQVGGFHYLFDAQKKRNISVMIPYADSLMLSSDWYGQLWGESLGKDGKGSTPVKALGATDQHSQIQLYMEGPMDKVITFVGVDSFRVNDDETKIENAPDYFSYLNGHNLGTILKAEQRATAAALAKQGRPNMTVQFPKVDAHHIGEFFMLYEIATAFAGALYGINPFDQPGVELGKVLTKEMLTAK